MKPIVNLSIVIPYFNSKETIESTVNSIQNKSNLNIEIIIVNDGSDETELSILDKIGSKNINTRIFNQNNRGVSSARNLGIDNARGEYILFLDSDDILIDALTSDIEKTIKKKPDIIVGNRRLFNLNTDELEEYGGYINNVMQADTFVEYSIQNNITYWNLGGYVCKKSFLDKNHIRFDKNLKSAEDLFFFTQMLTKSNYIITSENVFFQYNFGTENSSSMNITVEKLKNQINTYGYVVNNYSHLKNANKYFSSAQLRSIVEIENLKLISDKDQMYEFLDFKLKKMRNYTIKYIPVGFIIRILGIRKGNYLVNMLKGLVKNVQRK